MSARWKTTLVTPAARVRSRATASDSRARPIDMMLAPGMQTAGDRVGLIHEPLGLAVGVAVNVVVLHARVAARIAAAHEAGKSWRIRRCHEKRHPSRPCIEMGQSGAPLPARRHVTLLRD